MLRFLLLVLAIGVAGPALAERRVALVMADDDYRLVRPLANAVHDGEAMQAALKALGFEVTLETNRDLRRTRRALDDFRDDARGADVALVYFSGHGVEMAGENRLLPVDADASSIDALKQSSLPLEEISQAIGATGKIGLIVLDACRNDPFSGGVTKSGGRGVISLAEAKQAGVQPGLGRMGRSANMLFAFSAAPGETAADGSGGNSPFTAALVKYLGSGGLEIRSVLTLVQQEVYDQSRGKQLPYVESGLPQLFFTGAANQPLPERERLLLAMADVTPDLRQEVEQIAGKADMPLAPLYGALIGLDTAMPAAERSAKLHEAADAFVKVREAMQTLSSQDPKVAALRAEAERQLALGAFDTARDRLADAADIDSRSRQALKANFDDRTLSEAATKFLSGGAARADLRYDLAIQDYEEAATLFDEAGEAAFAPEPADQRLKVLESLGDLYTTVGDIASAAKSFDLLAQAAARRAHDDPSDPSIRRDLATAHRKHGATQVTLGQLDAAVASYRQALAILQDLVDKTPPRKRWLRDLGRTDDALGEALMAAGDQAGSLAAMQHALNAKQELAGTNSGDADLQRDITVSYDAIGDVLRDAGDVENAEYAYQASLDIRIALAEAMPNDAERQRDVSISRDKLGDVLRAKKDDQGALASYTAARDIVLGLAARDPQDINLQRDLSVSESKIGNVLRDNGELDAALSQFEKGLAIMRDLAARDPNNSVWQRDLSVCLEKVADVAYRQGDNAGALGGYEQSLAIMRKLSAGDGSNADWLHDISITLDQVGNLRIAARDYDGARAVLGESLGIRQRLAEMQPDNIPWQIDLIIGYMDYAQVAPDPRQALKAGIAVGEALQQAGRLSRQEIAVVDILRRNLARLQKRKK